MKKTALRALSINYKVVIHVLIWTVLTLLPFMISNAATHYSIGPIPGDLAVIMGLIHIAMFYTQALVLYPRFFCRKRWWLYVLCGLALIWASIRLKVQITEMGWPEVMTKNKHEVYKLIIGGSVEMFLLSLAYSRILSNIRRERKRKELEALQLATELKFLRNQISPHFLFNVLTNMVSLARKRSDQLEPALITLSELMRYMLYDTQGRKVPLSTEILYLNSYIGLQKMRFGNDVSVDCSIGDVAVDGPWVIEPMLLIPFVENAFKHGVGAVEQPQIVVRLEVKDGWMHFEVQNTYDETMSAGKEGESGLGLNNVRTRLGLLYPKEHTLTVRREKHWFQIVLTLKLI
jgi:sensor histidine kinase YesM